MNNHLRGHSSKRSDSASPEFESVRFGDASVDQYRRSAYGSKKKKNSTVGRQNASSVNLEPGLSSAAPVKKKRSIGKIIIIALVLLLIAALGSYLVLRLFFAKPIEDINVKGCNHLTLEEMTALTNIEQGSTLFDIDTAAIEQSIERDAWVKKAHVSKQYPSTLVIDITERDIQAIVEVPSQDGKSVNQWAIASDGMWLMDIPDRKSEEGQRINQQIYDDIDKVLHIENVPFGVDAKVGTFCTDSNVNNALNIIVALTTGMANQVKKVSAFEKESTTITLDNGVEIVFGNDSNIRDKERVALKIMEEYPNVVYINVRTPSQPTWRYF